MRDVVDPVDFSPLCSLDRSRNPPHHDVVQGSGRIQARTTGHAGKVAKIDVFRNGSPNRGTLLPLQTSA